MLDAARRAIRKLGAGARSPTGAIIVLLVVIGVALRLQGQLTEPSGLWFDEAVWARRVMERSPFAHSIRPFGFMWLTKVLATWFGATEFWLRFLSNVAGIGIVLLTPYVASQLFRSSVARILAVLLDALHPALNDLSKEFKPYSSDAFVHLGLIALYLRHRQTRQRGYLFALLGLMPLAFTVSFASVFVYPGLLVLTLLDGFKERGYRGAVLPIAAGVLCAVVTVTTYVTLYRHVPSHRSEEHYATKYNVFFQPKASAESAEAEADDDGKEPEGESATASTSGGRAIWLLDKYGDVAAFPGIRRMLWRRPALIPSWWGNADRWMWIGLCGLGLVDLVRRRRWTESTLLGVPLISVSVCNAMGLWPMGAFRADLFLCVYAVLIASAGADAIFSMVTPRALAFSAQAAAAALLLALYLLPGLGFGFDWSGRKQMFTTSFNAQGMLEQIQRQRERQLRQDPNAGKATVLVCPRSANAYWFYLQHHPVTRARHAEFFEKNFAPPVRVVSKVLVKQLEKRLRRPEAPPVWVVASKTKVSKVKRKLERAGQILMEATIDGDQIVALVGRKQEAKN